MANEATPLASIVVVI